MIAPDEPRRLIDGDDPMGGLLRRAAEGEDDPLRTGRAARVRRALDGRSARAPRSSAWRLAPGLVVAAAAAAAAWLVVAPRTEDVAPVAAVAEVAPVAPARPLRTAGAEARIPLPGGVALVARAGTDGEVVEAPAGRTVRLVRGAVRAEVEPRPGREPFAIEAWGYTVRVVGTVFEVSADGRGRVDVEVDRGVVAVSGPGVADVRVGAGLCWSSATGRVTTCASGAPEPSPIDVEPASGAGGAAAPEPAPGVAPRAPRLAGADGPASKAAPGSSAAPDAPAPRAGAAPRPYDEAVRLAAAGRYEQAATQFGRVVADGGPDAEIALYELAVLRQRRLGDLPGARRALEQYRRRHPAGALRQEADLTLVEVLAAIGPADRTLAESAAFLKAYPQSERRGEVHMVRGDLLRAAGSWRAALAEYDEVGPTPAGRAEAAAWSAAACAAASGDADGARRRLETYLERFPGGRHRAEARDALGDRD